MFNGLGLMAMTDGGGGIGRTAADLGVATISSGGALVGSPAASSYSAGTGGASAAAGASGDGSQGALSSPAISGAVAGLASFGPFGEGGPYTPIDYPAMRFLGQGESLANMQVKSGQVQPVASLWPVLALALGAILLLKD